MDLEHLLESFVACSMTVISHISVKILTREIHLMPTKYLQGRKHMHADAMQR